MDGRNFDDLARKLAIGVSRRNVLRGFIGSGVALGGLRGTSVLAASKVTICHFPPGNPGNLQVISVSSSALAGHLEHGDTVYGNCCVDADCAALSGACGVLAGCQADANGTSSCVYSDDSSFCDDGDACTGQETCQQSSCVAGEPMDCSDYGDQCNVGVCSGGECSSRPLGTDTGCSSGNACTTGDYCSEGACVPGNPITCNLPGECWTVGECDPDAGCPAPVQKTPGTACGRPASCVNGVAHDQDTCGGSGNCIPGDDTPCGSNEVCVDTACQIVCREIQEVCTLSDPECCDDGLTECHTYRCGSTGVALPKCCHVNGGGCAGDCDCCPGFQCVNDVCQPDICLELGDICDPNNNECCRDELAECHTIRCSETQTPLPRCCHPDGGSCSVDCDCCPGLVCLSGSCQVEETCGSIGMGCVEGACCGTLVCAGTPEPSNPFDVCVGEEGEPCRGIGWLQPFPGPISTEQTTDCNIWGGYTCGEDLYCTACGISGAACVLSSFGGASNSTCCLGMACINGVCTS